LSGFFERGKVKSTIYGGRPMPALASWISKKSDRCGGDACVRDTRITVWGLEAYRRLGMSDDMILAAVQGLATADLEAAKEYATANRDEISRATSENEEGDEGFVE
jgi:uncharacterized protein (DUF433 family)